ncbi:universal stress protein [Comamonas kerstersii]|uniref:universal stress protein n=1 Tax=Comamonas kerstersii TaxID=225992 RepID=UPI00266C4682|nr:universal stress protein [Comamonas kerstersii]
MYTHIMIAVDGSSESLQAVREALKLIARGLRTEIALVNVQEPASLLELATRDADAIAAAAVQAGENLMSEAAALLDAEGVGYSMEVVLGEPGSMLLEMAEDLNADMVIMGARGMGALKSAIVGSVSKTVITHCHRPVLVVRSPEEEDLAEAEAAEDAA